MWHNVCDVCMQKVISNLLNINFIHGHIHGWLSIRMLVTHVGEMWDVFLRIQSCIICFFLRNYIGTSALAVVSYLMADVEANFLCMKMYWTPAKMLLLADLAEYNFANAVLHLSLLGCTWYHITLNHITMELNMCSAMSMAAHPPIKDACMIPHGFYCELHTNNSSSIIHRTAVDMKGFSFLHGTDIPMPHFTVLNKPFYVFRVNKP